MYAIARHFPDYTFKKKKKKAATVFSADDGGYLG